jgi:hypothetical protein
MVKGTGGARWRKSKSSLNAMPPLTEFDQEQGLIDLESLIGELAKIKEDLKAKEALEEENKANLYEVMGALSLTTHSTTRGTVRIQAGRGKRKYKEEVVEAEARYKALKKLADDMGDYEEEPSKPSIVFNFPKNPEADSEEW